jgi:hypothetical protein
MAFGWEKFSYIQLIGFTILVAGNLMYNEVCITPETEGKNEADELNEATRLLHINSPRLEEDK